MKTDLKRLEGVRNAEERYKKDRIYNEKGRRGRSDENRIERKLLGNDECFVNRNHAEKFRKTESDISNI